MVQKLNITAWSAPTENANSLCTCKSSSCFCWNGLVVFPCQTSSFRTTRKCL